MCTLTINAPNTTANPRYLNQINDVHWKLDNGGSDKMITPAKEILHPSKMKDKNTGLDALITFRSRFWIVYKSRSKVISDAVSVIISTTSLTVLLYV
jgi:hypothetical protein